MCKFVSSISEIVELVVGEFVVTLIMFLIYDRDAYGF